MVFFEKSVVSMPTGAPELDKTTRLSHHGNLVQMRVFPQILGKVKSTTFKRQILNCIVVHTTEMCQKSKYYFK